MPGRNPSFTGKGKVQNLPSFRINPKIVATSAAAVSTHANLKAQAIKVNAKMSNLKDALDDHTEAHANLNKAVKSYQKNPTVAASNAVLRANQQAAEAAARVKAQADLTQKLLVAHTQQVNQIKSLAHAATIAHQMATKK